MMTYKGPWEFIWEAQRAQQCELGLDPNALRPMAKDGVVKDTVLGLQEEVAELARASTRFKAHLLEATPVETGDVLDGIVDVMKYVIALAQLHHITKSEVIEAFKRKTEVIRHKAQGQRLELEKSTPVIVVDLDGCLADVSGFDAKIAGMKTLTEQEEAKAVFRRTGGCLELPVMPGAKDAMAHLKEIGYKLVILTARPARRYTRLYADTMEWLKDKGIAHDLLLFGRDKAEMICEHIHPAKPWCFIEDRPKHALEVADLDIRVLLMGEGNKESVVTHSRIEIVNNWQEVASRVPTIPWKEM